MSIIYRNQAIARIAYACVQVDGNADPAEIDAVVQFLQDYPELFDAHDQTEVLGYLKDFLMRKPKIQEILPESRMKRIPEYLFGLDREVVHQLTQAIAESHEGISDIEAHLLAKLQPYLVPEPDSNQPEAPADVPPDSE